MLIENADGATGQPEVKAKEATVMIQAYGLIIYFQKETPIYLEQCITIIRLKWFFDVITLLIQCTAIKCI